MSAEASPRLRPFHAQPAWRRYIIRYSVGMAVFCALFFPLPLLSWRHRLPSAPWKYLIAAAPALPVAVVIWSMLRFLEEETDEYQRLLNTRAFIIATGMTLVITTGWGLMQWFAGVAMISLFQVFPLFLACQGLATGWVRWRAR